MYIGYPFAIRFLISSDHHQHQGPGNLELLVSSESLPYSVNDSVHNVTVLPVALLRLVAGVGFMIRMHSAGTAQVSFEMREIPRLLQIPCPRVSRLYPYRARRIEAFNARSARLRDMAGLGVAIAAQVGKLGKHIGCRLRVDGEGHTVQQALNDTSPGLTPVRADTVLAARVP